MADVITRQDLEDAKRDADDLAAVVTGDAVPGVVVDRLGNEHRTLAKLEADAMPLEQDFAAVDERLDDLEEDVANLTAVSNGGPDGTYYANVAAALGDGALANGKTFKVYPSTHGGAYDWYLKVSGVASTYLDTFYAKATIDALLATQLATLTRLRWATEFEKPSKNRPCRLLCTEDGRILISVRPQDAAYRGNASVTGSITTNILTVTAVASGRLDVGSTLNGTGIVDRVITALGTGTGGTGTYTVSAGANAASTAITATSQYNRHPGDLGHIEFVNFEERYGGVNYTLPHLWDACSFWSEFASTRIDQGNFSWQNLVNGSTFDNGEGQSTNSAVMFVDKMTNASGGGPYTKNGDAEFTASITGSTMTVSAVTSGTIFVGARVSGNLIGNGRFVTALGTGTGGVGTYTVSGAGDRPSQTMFTTGWNSTGSGVGHGLIDSVGFGILLYGNGGAYGAVMNGEAVADGTNIRDLLRPGDVVYCSKIQISQQRQYKTPDGTLAITTNDAITIEPEGVGQFQVSQNLTFQAGMGVTVGYLILLALRDPNRVMVRLTDGTVPAEIVTGMDPASAIIDNLGKAQNCLLYNTDTRGHCVELTIPTSYAPFRRDGAAVSWAGTDPNPFITRRAAGPKLAYPTHVGGASVDDESGKILSSYHVVNFVRANTPAALA